VSLNPSGCPSLVFEFTHYRNQGLVIKIKPEDRTDLLCFPLIDDQAAAFGVHIVTQHGIASDPLALAARGGHLVPCTSEIISRSNWAKESRMFNVGRPMELVVLNCWVTETKLTLNLPNRSMILAKSRRARLMRSTL
jgi:hypothetical protein